MENDGNLIRVATEAPGSESLNKKDGALNRDAGLCPYEKSGPCIQDGIVLCSHLVGFLIGTTCEFKEKELKDDVERLIKIMLKLLPRYVSNVGFINHIHNERKYAINVTRGEYEIIHVLYNEINLYRVGREQNLVLKINKLLLILSDIKRNYKNNININNSIDEDLLVDFEFYLMSLLRFVVKQRIRLYSPGKCSVVTSVKNN